MSTTVDREILGDWNNLKGSRYHLVFAVWLILRERAQEVRFFEGNDLLASPPAVADAIPSPLIPMAASSPAQDVWVQLKCTRGTWTPSALLDDNLLFNFVCNTFLSDHRGHSWRVWLVTEGETRREEVLGFVADPLAKPTLHTRLMEIIAQVSDALKGRGAAAPSQIVVQDRALEVLRFLAQTEPVMLATLKAEVEVELALACPDRQQVKRLGSLLLGAMLEDAAGGPARARPYDAAWVNEVTGAGVRSDRPFDVDVIQACDLAAGETVSLRLTPPFDGARHVRRAGLVRALEQFALAPETVFVLTGGSGSGKSCARAAWATEMLARHVRVLLRGPDVIPGATLVRLVADVFTQYSDRDWRDEQVLARLTSVAREPGKGPLVVLLDDLRPDDLEARGENSLLTRLVEALRAAGGKLIVSCEDQLWKIHRPWRHIPEGALFDPDRALTGEPTYRSYTLPAFTPEELTEAVRRRLPEGAGGRVPNPERLLLGPGHLPLRNPSLLARYLDFHGHQLLEAGTPPGPVNVDRLLAESVTAQLVRSASMIQADDTTLREAFDALIDRLWERRRSSLSHADAIGVLERHLPHQGPQALVALRRAGLIAAETPIRVLDGTVADHLYAQTLERRLREGSDELSHLDPDRDGTTVEALIRGSPRFTEWAEALLRRDERWKAPVALGLAQQEPSLRAYGLAAALTRPTGNLLVDRNGCLALGTLASRDEDIFDRVAGLYLGTDHAEALRGAEALAFALDYVPDRVCGLIRVRWDQERSGTTSEHRRSAGRRLSHTLLPLYRVNHREAALAARSTLDALVGSIDLASLQDADQLADRIDLIRGGLIPHEGADSLATLLRELASSDVRTRFRAAAVLRSVSHAMPEQVMEPLCAAIRKEEEPAILARLLRSTYRVLEIAPQVLLGAVEASRAVTWSEPTPAGAALALLGHAARFDPETIFRLLPRRLDGVEPWARACLADVLAFAWWRCAERRSEGRAVLESLCEPDLAGVAQAFQVFAERGAAVARLGLQSLGSVGAQSTTVSITQEIAGTLPYYYTNTRDLFLRHVEQIAHHPEVQGLAASLLRVVRAGHGLPFLPEQEALQSAQRIAARNALDELIEIALRQADPLVWIEDLPRDWEAIYSSRRLLQAGIRGEVLLAFATAACAEHARGGSVIAIDERERCLGEIALAGGNPGPAVAARFSDQSPSLFGSASESRTHGIAGYIDSHPEEIFTHLESAVTDGEGVVALFHWRGLARQWRSLLAAEVFYRMFDPHLIVQDEAIRLVGQMREVIRTLPPSPTREEYDQVYGAITSWLLGTPATLTLDPLPDTMFRRSHVLAGRLFQRAQAALAGDADHQWIDDFLWDRDCWWESDRYRIDEGIISTGRGEGIYLIVMLPALRLALVAVGQRLGRPDSAGQFMRERHDAMQRAFAARREAHYNPASRETALREVEGPDPSGLRDEHLLSAAGFILLLQGRLEQAEDRLRRALRSPLIDVQAQANVLYNLACVLARTGKGEECREALEEAARLNPGIRCGLAQDEDFSSVREQTWFQDLASQAPSLEG